MNIEVKDFICLYKKFGAETWNFSCVSSYKGCIDRANSIERDNVGASILIAQVVTTAFPQRELVWNSAMHEALKRS